MIDSMDGIEASYYFAGIVGISARGQTLKNLWRMACGKIRQRRFEMVEQAHLVWGIGEIDIDTYLLHGRLSPSGVGGPVKLTDELQAKIDAEVERIKQEGSGLPKIRGTA